MRKIFVNKDIFNEILKHLNSVKKSLWISTANLKELSISRNRKYFFIDKMKDLIKSGVEIKILHSRLPSDYFLKHIDRYSEFETKLFSMKMCIRVHFKTMIFDHKIIYLGSANLTGAGIGIRSINSRNFEVGLFSDFSEDIIETEILFQEIWEGNYCKKCLLKKKCLYPINM